MGDEDRKGVYTRFDDDVLKIIKGKVGLDGSSVQKYIEELVIKDLKCSGELKKLKKLI